MKQSPSIVLFRQDLRTTDHPALSAAAENGGMIIPLYVWAPQEDGEWPMGSGSKWWLHYSLVSLKQNLKSLNLDLIIKMGKTIEIIENIIAETGATAVFLHKSYEPAHIQNDKLLEKALQKKGITVHFFEGTLLFNPASIHTKEGNPFKVFTAFWNHCLKFHEPRSLTNTIQPVQPAKSTLSTLSVDDLKLLQNNPLEKLDWSPGEKQAHETLQHAIRSIVGDYPNTRDRPDLEGTSLLSPHMHFGEISVCQIWHATKNKFRQEDEPSNAFLRQLGWREFAYYLLYHFPQSPLVPLQEKFKKFPFKHNEAHYQLWKDGNTGYPLVDAGMRQLKHTGWMHNRVRMVVASFLVKHLMISWVEGAKWFWEMLVDADLANNSLGWQWVAGCGVDAAPYFRIFNPTVQGEKFDETREYVKKWVPELAALPDKWLYTPWIAPEILKMYGVVYPQPIVIHEQARKEALDAYATL